MRPKLPQVAWTGDGRTGHVGRGRVFAATRPAGGVARLIEAVPELLQLASERAERSLASNASKKGGAR